MQLTVEQREELELCDECMAAHCTICGHPPCPCCTDDCDNTECMIESPSASNDRIDAVFLEKTHTCIFTRCAKHKQFEIQVIDINTQQQRFDEMWAVLGDCFKGRLT